ncbi:MAG: DUF2298 domain-containing protein [Halobacteriales archaeon]
MEFGLVALWLAAFAALGLAALPLSAWLFRGLDAAAFAIPVALAVLAVVGHLVGHLWFGWPAALAGVLALLAGSAAVHRHVAVEWRAFGEAMAVFAAGFLLVVAIRAVDPSAAPLPVAIGEKFLDFGLLRTLERADALPPEDMWFAGRSVQYHYGGHMLTVLLGTLTATPARFAYNLGLAGFYGALVTAAYGLAGSIVVPHDASRRLAGALGAFFVGVAGNLETAARVGLWLVPDAAAGVVASLLGLAPEVAGWTPADFWYFDASRGVPIDPSAVDTAMAATEFPLFAWLNGDLHAHMMSQPFVLLAAGLCLAYWRAAGAPRRRTALLLGALPPVVGLVGVVNLWSFPTVGGLALLTVAFAPGGTVGGIDRRLPGVGGSDRPAGWTLGALRDLGVGAAVVPVVMALGVLWTLPYWLGVVLGGPSQRVALWAPWTPLGNLLLVHGAFLAAFVPALALRVAADVEDPDTLGAFAAAAFVAAVALGAPALGLFGPLLLAGLWLLRERRDGGYETVLVVAGLGLVLLVEVVTVVGERFNIVFKYYVGVWLFWATGAAAILAGMIGGRNAERVGLDAERWRRAGRGLAAALVLTTGLYGAFALPAHVAGDSVLGGPQEATLDATAYLGSEFPREAPAIRWLNEREGQPTIVTAAPGGYRWESGEGKGASAPASLTGLPTVLGWFHESQYRGQAAYERRLAAVTTIYTGSAGQQRRLVGRYGVEYVYVGPAERARYGRITIDDRPWTSVAFEGGSVTVYRVEI